jgi:type I restriction enzyme S subunit
MSENNGLPRGWTTTKIGDIVQLVNGLAFKKQQWSKFGRPIIRIQNLNSKDAAFNYCNQAIPTKYHVANGDLLFAWSGTPGTSFGAHVWNGGNAFLNQHIFRVEFDSDQIDRAFLKYAINRNLDDYIRSAHGAAGLAHITKRRFEDSSILVPPHSEQLRIVAKLEELFSDLDAGVAALEHAQANLNRYRSAVLKAAVEGRLTEKWRAEHPDVEPADRLLARILAERRRRWIDAELTKWRVKKSAAGWPATKIAAAEPDERTKFTRKYKEPAAPDTTNLPELPTGWCWATVEQLGDVQLGRQRSPKHHTGKHMRPYLRVANVFEDRIDISDVMEMNFTPEEFETYQLAYGDILLNEGQSMELVGRPAMYRDEVPGACFTNTLVRFRAHKLLNRDFALRVFLAYLKNGRFQRIATITVNIAHLGATRFAELEFPLPPPDEQREIVRLIDEHFSGIDAASETIIASFMRAARLRQSILKRAFEGQLVPQDPNDEPADVLLERIRLSRSGHEVKKTPKSSPRTRRISSHKRTMN